MWKFALAILLTMGISEGCGGESSGLRFHDEFDPAIDFSLDVPSEGLHLPYVVGSEIRGVVESGDTDCSGCSVESSNPDVLRVVESVPAEDGVEWMLETVSPGVAELSLVHGVELLESTEVEVVVPDSLVLYQGPSLLARAPSAALGTDPLKVVSGGDVGVKVAFRFLGEEAWGRGVVEWVAANGTQVKRQSQWFQEGGEWLVVSPTVGLSEIVLLVSGSEMASFDVEGVAESEIQSVGLLGPFEKGLDNGDLVAVFGIGRSSNGDVVHGLEFEWSLDDDLQEESGAMFRYRYHGGSEKSLAAVNSHGVETALIHSRNSWSSSSANCSTGGGPGPWTMATLVLLFLSIVLVFRSRGGTLRL